MHFDSFQPQGTFLATNFDFEILFYRVTKVNFRSQIQIQKSKAHIINYNRCYAQRRASVSERVEVPLILFFI